jgi:hypothetical protein
MEATLHKLVSSYIDSHHGKCAYESMITREGKERNDLKSILCRLGQSLLDLAEKQDTRAIKPRDFSLERQRVDDFPLFLRNIRKKVKDADALLGRYETYLKKLDENHETRSTTMTLLKWAETTFNDTEVELNRLLPTYMDSFPPSFSSMGNIHLQCITSFTEGRDIELDAKTSNVLRHVTVADARIVLFKYMLPGTWMLTDKDGVRREDTELVCGDSLSPERETIYYTMLTLDREVIMNATEVVASTYMRGGHVIGVSFSNDAAIMITLTIDPSTPRGVEVTNQIGHYYHGKTYTIPLIYDHGEVMELH